MVGSIIFLLHHYWAIGLITCQVGSVMGRLVHYWTEICSLTWLAGLLLGLGAHYWTGGLLLGCWVHYWAGGYITGLVYWARRFINGMGG